MTTLDLHHVGIFMPALEEVDAFMALFGLTEQHRGYVEAWSCWCVFTTSVNTTTIEFIVPNGGPLARFNKGAAGLHHVAIRVPSLDAMRAGLEQQGIRLLAEEHVRGAGDFMCNFVSPVYTRGIQVELIEELS